MFAMRELATLGTKPFCTKMLLSREILFYIWRLVCSTLLRMGSDQNLELVGH